MLLETLEYLGIAFVCSVLLIIMSKIILQALIRRPADYYDAAELRDEEIMLNAAGISITSEHETNPEGVPIEEKHLEAQLGDFEAVRPEEIITEIPDAVHKSIEIIPDDEEEDAEEPAVLEAETEEPEPEPQIVEPEPEPQIVEPELESEPQNVESEPEPEPQIVEPEPEPQIVEPEPQNVEPEPEPEAEEPDYTFKIKAKTSRTKKPKRKEDEIRAEEEAAARAAMEAAQAAADDGRVPEWSESYEDIRNSLEKAFAAAPDRKTDQEETVEDGSGSAPKKKKKSRKRKPKPSMKMNKKELTGIAVSRGIEVPQEATKRQILDLIYGVSDSSGDGQE